MINADKLFEKHIKFLVYTLKNATIKCEKVGIKCESDTESFVF